MCGFIEFASSAAGGALIAVIGTLIGALIAYIASVRVAKQNRATARADKLRDAIASVLVLRDEMLRRQFNLVAANAEFHARGEGDETQVMRELVTAAAIRYDSICTDLAHGVVVTRLITDDTTLLAALDELFALSDLRNEPIRTPNAPSQADADFRKRTRAAFDALDATARSQLMA